MMTRVTVIKTNSSIVYYFQPGTLPSHFKLTEVKRGKHFVRDLRALKGRAVIHIQAAAGASLLARTATLACTRENMAPGLAEMLIYSEIQHRDSSVLKTLWRGKIPKNPLFRKLGVCMIINSHLELVILRNTMFLFQLLKLILRLSTTDTQVLVDWEYYINVSQNSNIKLF